MKMMYLSPGVVSAMSALVTLSSDSLAGDSNFTPGCVLLGGNGRPSYFWAMVAALLRAGGTLSVSMPWIDGHMPPSMGFVPQTVVNPNRTCASSVGSTPSIALRRLVQEVLFMSEQTASPVEPVRQWNMLPDRSTSR